MMVISHTPNICWREFVFGAHRVWIGEGVDFGRGHTVFWHPPCMNPGERRLCHVWAKLQTYPIETYRNRADRLCVAGIGSSNFHLADFGFGRLLRLSPLRSNFAECTFTVPTQFESRLYSIFFRRDPFSIGITFYIHNFLYILSKAQQRIRLLYMYNMIYKYNDLKMIRLNSKNLNQILFY